MLLSRNRLLLAGIPTGAAFIVLLWLKRRRSKQSHHHTDPGGSLTVSEEEVAEKEVIEKEVKFEEIIKINKENISLIETNPFTATAEEATSTSVNKSIVTTTITVEELEDLKEKKTEVVVVEVEEVEADPVQAEVDSSIEAEAEEVIVQEEKIIIKDTNCTENSLVEVTSITTTNNNTTTTTNNNSNTNSTTMKTDSVKLAVNLPVNKSLTTLELDTMKISDENVVETEQKACSERDSANHSPSEVMLASPSISNFSDAHSEGSSDSGKGHSDVATSPSRTPAGGSSLAGDLSDLSPSIYEFILPQVMVGRLIGRRGTFLHEIRSSTQTNIYIKRHPDTNKLKICAIEGSQPDIDKALAKIRQKFPVRRFPQLTLEKVSFVTLNPLPPLKLEDFHLQLVEGVNNDVILSSLITAAHFFLQQPSHPSYGSLGSLNEVMNQVYSTAEAPTLETPVKDAVCAAPTMGGWYRAQIVSIDEDSGYSTVRFLDYGGYLVLESSCLRQIRGDLLALPFQAVECYLANVTPAGEEGWTEEARLLVYQLTVGQVLQAQIYDIAEDGTPLVYLYASYGSQVVLINEELVMRGFGVLTTSNSIQQQQEE